MYNPSPSPIDCDDPKNKDNILCKLGLLYVDVFRAIDLNLSTPFVKAEYIATRSAHMVLGYAADSTLQPKKTLLSEDNKAQPT